MSEKPEKYALNRETPTDPRSSSQLLRENTPSPTKQEIEDEQTTTSTTRRMRGDQALEHTHERITLWLDKDVKARFETLAETQGAAKSTLLDEAIRDLLKKHEPYEER